MLHLRCFDLASFADTVYCQLQRDIPFPSISDLGFSTLMLLRLVG